MSKLLTMSVLACAVALAHAIPVDTQGSMGRRVEPFKRPAAPRVPRPPDSTSPLDSCQPQQDEMCQRFRALAAHFLTNNKIPARDRELLTLRTGWLNRGEYIWSAHHADYARTAGLTAEEVARVMKGPEASGWSTFDATLLRAVDELQASRFISDATWKALGERYNDRQRLEVVLTVANYTMLAMYFNSTGAQLREGKTGFPVD
jgi:alkylhydroperoxidase family enzyme